MPTPPRRFRCAPGITAAAAVLATHLASEERTASTTSRVDVAVRGATKRAARAPYSVDELLPRAVEEVRHELGLDAPPPPARVRDLVAAMLTALPAAAIGPIVAVLALAG